jgi:hypothetical protein
MEWHFTGPKSVQEIASYGSSMSKVPGTRRTEVASPADRFYIAQHRHGPISLQHLRAPLLPVSQKPAKLIGGDPLQPAFRPDAWRHRRCLRCRRRVL